MSILDRQILKLLINESEEEHDPQDTITGFGNYITSKGIPPPKSKEIVNKIIREVRYPGLKAGAWSKK